jgi:protein-L-isoaspartate(D-aspartate) O-methyltransferase
VALAAPTLFDQRRREALVTAMTRLLTANPIGLSATGGPLAGYRPWIAAFEQAGQALLTLAQAGRLRRGLRAVLAHHILFHANRGGISVSDLCAPRSASSYPQRSWEELEGRFLGLMPYLEPKGI